jgi:hypothetical protein
MAERGLVRTLFDKIARSDFIHDNRERYRESRDNRTSTDVYHGQALIRRIFGSYMGLSEQLQG